MSFLLNKENIDLILFLNFPALLLPTLTTSTPSPPKKIQGTAMLSNTSLVQICLHLGALNMFPHRLAATLDLILPARLQEQQCQPQVGKDRWEASTKHAWQCPHPEKLERSHHQSSQIRSIRAIENFQPVSKKNQ